MREFYASRDALPDLGFGSGFSICVLSEHNILFDTKTFLYNIKHLSMIIWMSSLHFKEKSQLENICHCGWTWQGAAGVERGQEHESDVCFTQTLLTQLHISLVVLWSERERERGLADRVWQPTGGSFPTERRTLPRARAARQRVLCCIQLMPPLQVLVSTLLQKALPPGVESAASQNLNPSEDVPPSGMKTCGRTTSADFF